MSTQAPPSPVESDVLVMADKAITENAHTIKALLDSQKVSREHIRLIDERLAKLGHVEVVAPVQVHVSRLAKMAKAMAPKAKGGHRVRRERGSVTNAIATMLVGTPSGLTSAELNEGGKASNLTPQDIMGGLQGLRRAKELTYALPKGQKRGGVYKATAKLITRMKTEAKA